MRKSQDRVFYGWWVLTALLIIEIIGPMGRYSMTAFFPFVSSEFGWSRSLVGSAQSMNLWVYAVLVPLSGWMVDHFGGRKTLFLGGFLSLVGWILLSTMKIPWQLYAYYGLIMGLVVSMIHMVPIQATANKWFRKRAGLVTGITSAGFGVGVAIFVPVMTNISNSLGWRSTSILYGVSSGTIIILLALYVIRDTPESIGLHLDNRNSSDISENNLTIEKYVSVSDAIKTVPFCLLFVAYSLVGIPLQGILGHLVMWGVDTGSSKAAAGTFVTAMFLPSIASKIGGGWIGDRLGKKRVIVISQLYCVLLMLWAWQSIHTSQTLKTFSIFLGIGYGIPMGLFTPYLTELFGRANVGALFGILTLGHGLIGGCGPLLWGHIFDTYGNYNLACLISAICYGAVAIAVFLISSTPKESKIKKDLHPCLSG